MTKTKCPKTMSGKHKWIDGIHFGPTQIAVGGSYPGGYRKYDNPVCEYCGIINDK